MSCVWILHPSHIFPHNSTYSHRRIVVVYINCVPALSDTTTMNITPITISRFDMRDCTVCGVWSVACVHSPGVLWPFQIECWRFSFTSANSLFLSQMGFIRRNNPTGPLIKYGLTGRLGWANTRICWNYCSAAADTSSAIHQWSHSWLFLLLPHRSFNSWW